MPFTGVSHKVGEHIDTDAIIPARFLVTTDPKKLGENCMEGLEHGWVKRVQVGDILVAERNFGCGSSREHAALVPLYLGVKAVITKSFARIHQANLINAGILPFTFANEADYDKIDLGDELRLPDVRAQIAEGKPVMLENATKNECYPLAYSFSQRQTDMLLAGGLLNYTREHAN